LVEELIKGARENGFGRPVNVQFAGFPENFFSGVKIAAEKFALQPETIRDLLEVGGLGMLAIPTIHHMATAEKPMDKAMAGTELAGLGVLAAHPLHGLLKR
jgi:hypothetical protein